MRHEDSLLLYRLAQNNLPEVQPTLFSEDGESGVDLGSLGRMTELPQALRLLAKATRATQPTRRCRACGKHKPRTEFYPDRGAVRARCKDCAHREHATRYARNPAARCRAVKRYRLHRPRTAEAKERDRVAKNRKRRARRMSFATRLVDLVAQDYGLAPARLRGRAQGRAQEAQAMAARLIRWCTFLEAETIGALLELAPEEVGQQIKVARRLTNSMTGDIRVRDRLQRLRKQARALRGLDVSGKDDGHATARVS